MRRQGGEKLARDMSEGVGTASGAKYTFEALTLPWIVLSSGTDIGFYPVLVLLATQDSFNP
eukprot:761142-Hanusia_phi.AAC.3